MARRAPRGHAHPAREVGMSGPPVVLLVDDERAGLQLLSALLDRQGYRVITAETASKARELLTSEAFDLAIFDVHLPDGDGLDLCRKTIGEPLHLDVPVLMLSAETDVAVKLAAFEAGAVDYVTKPYSRQEVLARVR